MAKNAFCPTCRRTVQLAIDAEATCPVCSSPLIEEHGETRGDDSPTQELTERLLATLDLYAQDKQVDVDAAAARLIELAKGNWAALDQAHKRAVLYSGSEPDDAVAGRSVDITRRAVERAGSC